MKYYSTKDQTSGTGEIVGESKYIRTIDREKCNVPQKMRALYLYRYCNISAGIIQILKLGYMFKII